LSIRCTNAVVKAGDEISIEFRITNGGTNEYKYADRTYDRSGRMEEYMLVVKTASGELVPDPRATYTGGIAGGLHGYKTLKSGESFTKVIPLNRWALVKEAGRYEVVGHYPSVLFGSNSVVVTSAPITITVQPRSEKELYAYICSLTNQLAALATNKDYSHRGEVDTLVMKLMFTCSPKIVPTLLNTMYEAERGFWESEALQFYVPRSDKVKRAILSVAAKRGLASGMQYVLTGYGCDRDDFVPLIKASLAPENRTSWQEGALAAQQYSDDAFTPRLIALATERNGAARGRAIYALALNRTDEGVQALKALLVDADKNIRSTTENAIRTAYRYRGNSKGRLLKPEDFDSSYQQAER
jgi:hypothetical protein